MHSPTRIQFEFEFEFAFHKAKATTMEKWNERKCPSTSTSISTVGQVGGGRGRGYLGNDKNNTSKETVTLNK